MNMQKRNRHTDAEDKLVVSKGESEGEEADEGYGVTVQKYWTPGTYTQN